MRRLIPSMLLLGLLICAPAMAGGPCCDKAKADDGWCSGCNHGFVYNVSIAKKALYDALAAVAVNDSCEGCKKVAATGGVCEKCHVGIAHGKAYKAMPVYYVAAGEKQDAAKIGCPACAGVCKTGLSSWCEKCKGGLVACRSFTDKAQYDKASSGLVIIQTAAKNPCEGCSVAMVTDGACDHCKVTYKDGKPTKS